MGDASFNASKHTGTKPKLSLLSSKQSGIRLRSEDQPDQQITILSSKPDDYANIININSNVDGEHHAQIELESHPLNPEKESQPLNGNTQNDENKMNISKEDLIRLLSMLRSELQSKEIALAAIKCEQLKRLINPVEISRSSLANTYIELQDRFKICDQNNNTKKVGEQPSCASAENQRNGQPETVEKQTKDQDSEDRESLNILNTLLELLDRHPLLALPRDSIYCLDYNCNELSTKNYLNLKIQHLDNLINQHRRFRFYMNERLKRSEQRYLDLTRELELERSLKFENEKSLYKTSGKSILLKHINQLKETLEKEKKDKQAIVMTLLNELLDERERIEILAKKLADHELNSANSIEKITGEKEKLLMMEAELTSLSMQLKKQSMVFAKERNELQSKVVHLETDNKSLKIKLEQQEKHLATLMKSTISTSDTKESNPLLASVSSNPSRAKQAIQVGKQTSNSSTPAVVSRSSIGSTVTKSSPSPKTSPSNSNSATQGSSGRMLPQSASSSSNSDSLQSSSVGSRQASMPSVNQRPSAPVIVSRLLGGSNSAEHTAPVRIQPLFKSASVSSTSQQVRNLKTSVSSGGGSSNTPLARVSSNNQPVTKPQVPAKPAQLLDQQRNSLN